MLHVSAEIGVHPIAKYFYFYSLFEEQHEERQKIKERPSALACFHPKRVENDTPN